MKPYRTRGSSFREHTLLLGGDYDVPVNQRCPDFQQCKVFSEDLKKARKKLHLTQATCAELLDLSVSFEKDLECCRCSPSIENFYHICRTLSISADDCIFPEYSQKTNSTYHELLRLLSLCDESSLKILTATATALISEKQNMST